MSLVTDLPSPVLSSSTVHADDLESRQVVSKEVNLNSANVGEYSEIPTFIYAGSKNTFSIFIFTSYSTGPSIVSM